MAGGVFTGVVDEVAAKEGLFCAGVADPKRLDDVPVPVFCAKSAEVPDGVLEAGAPNKLAGVVVVP